MSRKRGQGYLFVPQKHPDAVARLVFIKLIFDEIEKLPTLHISNDVKQYTLNEVQSANWDGSWVSLSSTRAKRRILTFRRHGENEERYVVALCHEDSGDAQFFLKLSRVFKRRSIFLECEVREPADFDDFYNLLLRREYFHDLIEADKIPPKDPYRRP